MAKTWCSTLPIERIARWSTRLNARVAEEGKPLGSPEPRDGDRYASGEGNPPKNEYNAG